MCVWLTGCEGKEREGKERKGKKSGGKGSELHGRWVDTRMLVGWLLDR